MAGSAQSANSIAEGRQFFLNIAFTSIVLWIILFFFLPRPLSQGWSRLLTEWTLKDHILWTITSYEIACGFASFMLIWTWVQNRRLGLALLSAGVIVTLEVRNVPLLSFAIIAIVPWAVFVLVCILSDGWRIYILWVSTASLGLHMALGLVMYLFASDQFITPGFGKRASGVFDSPDTLYPLCILSFHLFHALAPTWRTTQWLGRATAALSLLVLVLTFSRAGWIGFAASLLLMLRRGKMPNRLLYAGIAVVLFTGACTIRSGGQMVRLNNDRSTASRPVYWNVAVQIWTQQPWYGSGAGGFARVCHHMQDMQMVNLKSIPSDPKSLLLNCLVETGFIGTVAYTALFWMMLRQAPRLTQDQSSRALAMKAAVARALTLTMVAFLVAGLADTPIFGGIQCLPATIVVLVLLAFIGTYVTESVPFLPRAGS